MKTGVNKVSKNEENFALKVINESLKLPFVKVNRSEFLIKIFGDQIIDKNTLLNKGPQAFFSKEELDKKAQSRINVVVTQSSSISFATGIPGGLAMAATIPADIVQFYAYSIKLAQEISYIYGYEDMWSNQGELSEDAKNTLILYLGIMLGVTSAGSVIRVLSSKLSAQALKKIPQKALTKTFYYPIIKKVLATFGTKLTKASFAKGVSKVIPVVGGVFSGSINYFSMKPMAIKLKNELGKSVNYDYDELNRDLKILKDEDVEIVISDSDINVSNLNKNFEDTSDIFEQIEKAHELLAKGMISEEEFNELKKNILSKI